MRGRLARSVAALALSAAACTSGGPQPAPTPEATTHDFTLRVAVIGVRAEVATAVTTVQESIRETLDAVALPDVAVEIDIVEPDARSVGRATLVIDATPCEGQAPASPNAVRIEVVCPDDDDPAAATWRLAPSMAMLASAYSQVMGRALGADATIALGRTAGLGVALTDAFLSSWTQQGEIGPAIAWDPEEDDAAEVAAKLVEGDPEGWLIAGTTPDDWALLGPELAGREEWAALRTFVSPRLQVQGLAAAAGPAATDGLRGLSPPSLETAIVDGVVLGFLASVAAGSADAGDVARALPVVSGPGGDATTADRLEDGVRTLLAGDPVNLEGTSGALDLDAGGELSVISLDIWRFEGGQVETLETFRAERPVASPTPDA